MAEKQTIDFPWLAGHEVYTLELVNWDAEKIKFLQSEFGKSNFGEWRKEGLRGKLKKEHPDHPNFWLVEYKENSNIGGLYSVYHIWELDNLTVRNQVAEIEAKPLTDWLSNVK
jgi:hypothetical protein